VHTTLAPARFAPVTVSGTVVPWVPLAAEVAVIVVVWLSPLARVICRRLPTASYW